MLAKKELLTESNLLIKKRSSFAGLVAAYLVRVYQLFLSPLKYFLFGPTGGCRFHPTCSCYAREAFLERGFWCGILLTVKRIFRCHPFSSGGYDPLPPVDASNAKTVSKFSNSIIDG